MHVRSECQQWVIFSDEKECDVCVYVAKSEGHKFDKRQMPRENYSQAISWMLFISPLSHITFFFGSANTLRHQIVLHTNRRSEHWCNGVFGRSEVLSSHAIAIITFSLRLWVTRPMRSATMNVFPDKWKLIYDDEVEILICVINWSECELRLINWWFSMLRALNYSRKNKSDSRRIVGR